MHSYFHDVLAPTARACALIPFQFVVGIRNKHHARLYVGCGSLDLDRFVGSRMIRIRSSVAGKKYHRYTWTIRVEIGSILILMYGRPC